MQLSFASQGRTGEFSVGDAKVERCLGRLGDVLLYEGRDPKTGQVWLHEYFPLDVTTRDGEGVARARTARWRGMFREGAVAFLDRGRKLIGWTGRNALPVLSVVDDDTGAWWITPASDGQTLAELLAFAPSPLPQPLAREIAKEVSAALTALHKTGLAHGGVSPSAFLLTADADWRALPVGLEPARTLASRITPRLRDAKDPWISLERQRAQGDVGSVPDDIHGLAAVLSAVLLGETPKSSSQRLYAPGSKPAPGEATALARGLALQPEDRPASVAALIKPLPLSRKQIGVRPDLPQVEIAPAPLPDEPGLSAPLSQPVEPIIDPTLLAPAEDFTPASEPVVDPAPESKVVVPEFTPPPPVSEPDAVVASEAPPVVPVASEEAAETTQLEAEAEAETAEAPEAAGPPPEPAAAATEAAPPLRTAQLSLVRPEPAPAAPQPLVVEPRSPAQGDNGMRWIIVAAMVVVGLLVAAVFAWRSVQVPNAAVEAPISTDTLSGSEPTVTEPADDAATEDAPPLETVIEDQSPSDPSQGAADVLLQGGPSPTTSPATVPTPIEARPTPPRAVEPPRPQRPSGAQAPGITDDLNNGVSERGSTSNLNLRTPRNTAPAPATPAPRPAPLAALGAQDITQTATAQQMTNALSAAARTELFRGARGQIQLSCVVGSGGVLNNCRVAQERPAGLGFGASALRLAPYYRARTVDGSGQSTINRSITFWISFTPQG